ncbi:hypothetical protein KC329_g71 [Hortaea werneckii]|nr:hypothetical protein KC329_g71 [Hortaea werneckii]
MVPALRDAINQETYSCDRHDERHAFSTCEHPTDRSCESSLKAQAERSVASSRYTNSGICLVNDRQIDDAESRRAKFYRPLVTSRRARLTVIVLQVRDTGIEDCQNVEGT